jgi:aminopeptidase N
MTREDIIRMAAQAGFAISKWDDGLDEVMDGDNYHIQTDQVIDFANLVAAVERNKVAQWMIARSYATGHGDTVEDLLKELAQSVREEERELCAQVCDEIANAPLNMVLGVALDCAAAIRTRVEK